MQSAPSGTAPGTTRGRAGLVSMALALSVLGGQRAAGQGGASAAAPAAAPAAAAAIAPEAYHERRGRLAQLAKEGVVVIQSVSLNQTGITEYFIDHSDNHDFLYLTGLDSTSATLLLLPQSTLYPEILFVPAGDVERAQARTGIKNVMPDTKLMDVLSEALTDYSLKRVTERRHKLVSTEVSRVLSLGPRKTFFFDYPRFVNIAGDPPARLQLPQRLQFYSPEVEIRNATPLLTTLRSHHDKADMEQIATAVRIGSQGLLNAMKACKPGAFDYQVDAVAEGSFKHDGASRQAYPPLTFISPFGRPVKALSAAELGRSSEPQSAIHQMQSGDLVMLDAGDEFHHYASDLSRMVPVSGKFTPEQRKLYEAVLAAHHAAIAAIRPGATIQAVHNAAVEELRKRGLDQYFTFGTSHFIGMDGHDPGNYEAPLEPGEILTVEPGIIDNEKSITIHVEDMILVTEQGHTILSADLPIEVADIEKLMSEK
jgi:Xaa-Pro aminopeptidase